MVFTFEPDKFCFKFIGLENVCYTTTLLYN